MIKEAILKLAKKEDLTYDEAEKVMDEIMSGEATPVQPRSFLKIRCGRCAGSPGCKNYTDTRTKR